MNPTLKRFIFPFSKREPSPRDRYAGYHERVFASTVDLACLFILLYEPFSWLGRMIYGESAPSELVQAGANMSWQQAIDAYLNSELAILMGVNLIIQLVIIGILLISCQYGFGTTPGRYIVGLKLVDAKTESEPTLFQLIRRYLGYFISLTPLMLGYIWCNWDTKRQTWHDKIAGTVVLDIRPNGWYWEQIKRLWYKMRGKEMPAAPVKDEPKEP